VKRVYALLKDADGSITITMVIMMFAFVGLLSFGIDLAHLQTVKNELQNAADACALRGARAFYPDSIHGLEKVDQPDPDNAKTQASLTVGYNKSDDNTFHIVPLTDLPEGEIDVGIWDYIARQLTPWRPLGASDFGTYVGPGIRLPVKRTDSHNQGPVSMTLAKLFNVSQVSVSSKATAALSGLGGFVPGSPTMPFGTWDNMLSGPGQILHGTFRNDTNDTLGWTNLDPNDTNPNANELKKLLTDPTGASTPNCPTGSIVGIQNGQVASAIQSMTKQSPLNRFGLIDMGGNVYQPSNNINPLSPTGETYANTVYMMPVYSDGSGGLDKFNQSAVVGAVLVQIVQVTTSPGNSIDLKIVDGTYVAPGYSGGKFYGILSTDPKLVQ
jgi:hypothetical protein